MFRASVITLFPEAFPGTLGLSLIGKAMRDGLWSLETINLREFGLGPHKTVDDTPAGGGPGMVIRADVAAAAIDHALAAQTAAGTSAPPLVYMSPRGEQLTQAIVQDWARGPGIVILCGRFEGLDERVIAARGLREIAVGEAVLAGGEAAASVAIEACVRLLPGVLGNEASTLEESFSDGLLEHPQYTRPREWEGRSIPDVLLSGDHARIAKWRLAERQKLTAKRRP